MSQTPIIIQLQMEAADQNVSVSSLLRKAKIIATKLDLAEFLQWIDYELKGYEGLKIEALPSYRRTQGDPKAFNPYRGWQPIMFRDAKSRELISSAPIGQAIGPLEEMALQDKGKDSGSLEYTYSPEVKQNIIDSLEYPTDVKLIISMSAIHTILDAVRNSILEWALKLEKAGIMGENLSFSEKEKIEAKPVTQQIFAQNIGHVGNAYDQAQTTNNQTARLNLNSGNILSLVSEIEKTIQFLPAEHRSPIQKQLEQIHTELKKPETEQDQSKLRGALGSIKTVCEGIAGNVIAQGIISMISGI